MVLFDVAASFLIGGAIGVRGRGQRRDLALVAGGLGMAPAGVAFLELYPDWDWQYLLDPAGLPAGSTGLFVAAIVLAAIAGHAVGAKRPRALWGALALFAVYLLWSLPRLVYVGSRAEYLAGAAPFLPAPFLIHFAWIGALAAGLIAWCVWASRSERRVE